MAAKSNGSLKKSNGHVNGGVNGNANTNLSSTRGRSGRKTKGFVSWTFHAVARLFTYFAIYTLIFRCPDSLDACDQTSPFICKYYFQTKAAVLPHAQPYWDQYAAPYVEVAQPYYDSLNQRVVAPSKTYAIQYGAPWVNKAREYGNAQWEKNGQPQLQELQALAQAQYDKSVAPHLAQASDVLGPYYNLAKTGSINAYNDYLLPGYVVVQPYARQGYEIAADFTKDTALPATWWAWNNTYSFLHRAVWPQIRVAYLENVEPQLVRIGERLGRYTTKSKTKSASSVLFDRNTPESSFQKPTSAPMATSTTTETAASTPRTAVDDVDFVAKPVEAPPAAENESQKRQDARKMVAEDLELWQTKFATQADEGANDMEARVDEIAKRMISNDANINGKRLVEKLEATVTSAVEDLKEKISAIVERATGSPEAAEAEAISAVRAAGVVIKEQAQAVREWRKNYDTELHNTVVEAADIHFQILDETRNLALQQIGMRWAWADGVTYKDWEKYHELKRTLREWTDQLKQLIVSHPSLLQAQEASAEVEDESMEIASSAAKELGRLKEVAHWKVIAKDATDNYDLEAMKQAAEEVARVAAEASRKAAEADATIVEKAQEVTSIVGQEAGEAASAIKSKVQHAAASGSDTVVDGAGSASFFASSIIEDVESSVVSAASGASDFIADQSTAASQSASSVLSEGGEATGEVAEELEKTVKTISLAVATGSERLSQDASTAVSQAQSSASEVADGFVDDVQDAVSSASDYASSVASDASSILSAEGSSLWSEATSSSSAETVVESLASEASEGLFGATASIVANVSGEDILAPAEAEMEDEAAIEDEEVKPSDATASVKPAMFGAAAQKVPERKPILDDYEDNDVLSNVGASAQAAYSNAVAAAAERYSSAASVVSAQIYGTPKPVHEELFASVSNAYDRAVAAASSRFSDVAAAATAGIKGTTTAPPTPTSLVDWSKVEAIAAQRLNEGRLWAEIQYQSAVIALGIATPEPKSPADRYLKEAKKNYYAGIGLAQERYSSFVAAASSAMSSLTATPTPTDFAGSASSWASAAQASVLSAANAAEQAANAAYSAATENVAAAINAVDEGIVSVIDAASEQVYLTGNSISNTWDSVIGQISGQIYGEEPKQIGWYDSFFKDASSAADAATGAAEDAAASASAQAAKQYSAVNELVSELVSGKEPSFTESVLSRLKQAYATAVANVGSYANEASDAAASVGEKISSAASQATEAVKASVQGHSKDEL